LMKNQANDINDLNDVLHQMEYFIQG